MSKDLSFTAWDGYRAANRADMIRRNLENPPAYFYKLPAETRARIIRDLSEALAYYQSKAAKIQTNLKPFPHE